MISDVGTLYVGFACTREVGCTRTGK